MVHFFVIILNSHVWDEENTTDGHIRRHSFNNRSMAGRWGGEGRSTTVVGVRYTLIGSSVSFSRPPILKIRNDLCFSIRSNTGGGGENGWRSGWRRSVVPCSLSFPLPSLFCFTGKVQFTDKLREL